MPAHSLSHLRSRLVTGLVAVVALAALSAPGALASAGRPSIGKVYKCISDSTGLLTFVQALELKSRSVYLVAPSYKGNRLVGGTAKGRYRERGRRIKYLSGAFKKYTSVYHPAGKNSFISMLAKGVDFEDCYLHY